MWGEERDETAKAVERARYTLAKPKRRRLYTQPILHLEMRKKRSSYCCEAAWSSHTCCPQQAQTPDQLAPDALMSVFDCPALSVIVQNAIS